MTLSPEQVQEIRALADAGKEAHYLAFEKVPDLCDTIAAKDELIAFLGTGYGLDQGIEIKRCPNCDGSGQNAHGSCCRIRGHAKDCPCYLCEWMRSSYRKDAEIADLQRTMCSFISACDGRDETKSVSEDFTAATRKTIAQIDQWESTVADLLAGLNAASLYLTAVETCHICTGKLVIDETPVHCENCSWDCHDHDEPDCVLPDVLHAAAKKQAADLIAKYGGGQ